MANKNTYNQAKRAAKKYPAAAMIIAILLVIIIASIAIFWVLRPDIFHIYVGTGSHVWSEDGSDGWAISKQVNVCENGVKERECLWCGYTEYDIIKATEKHSLDDETKICTVCGFDGNAKELSIHFLELGNKYTGDCTLIKCGDTEVLIDAGSRQNSAETIKAYVDQYCEDGKLEYVIVTHAHQDHIAGFVGNSIKNSDKKTGILYQYEIGTIIQFAGHNTTSTIYKNYVQAVDYAKDNGAKVYTAKECREQTNGARYEYYLDEETQTVSMTILDSYYYYNETKDENDYSVCMLLSQEIGGGSKNYLFTGDLEEKGESYLVDRNDLPQVDLFKGGHHGSYTASTEKLLKVIKPKNVAVCCCCGTTEYTSNKRNTFPAQAFINRVAVYTKKIYCTTLIVDYKAGKYQSMNGNIMFYTEGGELKVNCSNNDTILKETAWFKENRTWPTTGVQ